jgi:acetyltransferase-like isoleucine patch superfamily enzyme
MSDRWTLFRRLVTPGWVTSIRCFLRYRAKVSPKSEIEFNDNLRLGSGVVIGSFTKIKCSDGLLEIGNEVLVGNYCFIAAHPGGVSIGSDTMIGPFTTIVGSNYRYDSLDIPISKQPKISKGVKIGSGAWIGANTVVLDGAIIGNGVIVTPGSVVAGKVKDNLVVQGNPAKPIFRRR